jgi:hypothetical protein
MTSLAAAVAMTGELNVMESLGKYKVIQIMGPWSKGAVLDVLNWFDATRAEHLLLCLSSAPKLEAAGLDRLRQCADETGAAIVYSDYFDADGSPHPLIDYQPGSLRNDFDFGPVVLLNKKSLAGLAGRIEMDTPELKHAGWYDLRLRLVERGPVERIPEPLYRLPQQDDRPSGSQEPGGPAGDGAGGYRLPQAHRRFPGPSSRSSGRGRRLLSGQGQCDHSGQGPGEDDW